MCILIVGREFAISGLRSIAASEGYLIKANEMGKTKMLAQVGAISAMFLSLHHPLWHPFAMGLMWIVVLFSILSAVSYFRKFWRKIDERVKQAAAAASCFNWNENARANWRVRGRQAWPKAWAALRYGSRPKSTESFVPGPLDPQWGWVCR